jgi:hypothetical protein
MFQSERSAVPKMSVAIAAEHTIKASLVETIVRLCGRKRTGL